MSLCWPENTVCISTSGKTVHCPLLYSGDPSVFVRLIHDGQLRLEQVEDHSEDELRGILDQCGQSVPSGATKVGDGQRARRRCLFFYLFFCFHCNHKSTARPS